MRFVDECEIRVEAGDGGNGAATFRRESHVPLGGPSGGDGGNGGHVIFVGDEGKNSLLDLQHTRVLRAEPGERGRSRDQYGRAGAPCIVRVPVGTIATDRATGRIVGEVLEHNQELIVARGGHGGRGNIHFATSTDRAPTRFEPGTPGEQRDLRLELRVMADVGLLGFPNVGKSTFIATVSAARPKVADYPFTTLVPQLGVVKLDDWVGADEGETFVAADIPGLVPGAAEGAGLGVQFLKHVERCRVLLHLVSLDYSEDRNPTNDYDIVRTELAKFDPLLANRPEIVCLSKADLTETREAYPALREAFAERGIELRLLSAATREGVKEVIKALRGELRRIGPPEKNS